MRTTLQPRLVQLTTRSGIEVRRTLPHREIRTIGAWCFLDDYGPNFEPSAMSVAAHPHAGLQTVTWLFEGEVEHRDSLGSVAIIRPGQLNIMTAGKGISHSELSTKDSQALHGVQLWTVLPSADQYAEPTFDHYESLPTFAIGNFDIRLFMGAMNGHDAHTKNFSPLVGAEIKVAASIRQDFELNSNFEYGFLIIEGSLTIDEVVIEAGELHYIDQGVNKITISSLSGSKFLLLGGEPFTEEIIMWWNFIARSHEQIVELREKWNNHSPEFPRFEDRIGGRIPAPALPNMHLSPRGSRR